jgi:hypothetical protein
VASVGLRRIGLPPFRHCFRDSPRSNILMLPETSQSRPSGSNSCETDHGIATYNAQPMSYTLGDVLESKQVRSCSRRIVKLGHRRAASFLKARWSSLLHSHVGLLRKQQTPKCDSALELEGSEGGLAVFCWTTRLEGTKASKTNNTDNNTNETNKPWKVIPRKKPRKPEIRNRRKRKQKSQKSSSPRRSRPSLSLLRLRPHR